MRKILKLALKLLAKQVIRRYRPIVVGVTGSVGKTTAKEAIYAVLSKNFWVTKNQENFNNEFGVPYAVLGINPSKIQNKKYKIQAMGRAIWLAFGWRQRYPRVLVLELAADRPGDIGYLVDIVQPTVGVITAIGEVPVHVEFYASSRHVAKEKAKLIQALLPAKERNGKAADRRLLSRDSLAVLNYDDQSVLDMKVLTKTNITTFGFTNAADLWVSDLNYFLTDQADTIGGLSFKIHQGEAFVPMRLTNMIAPHQLYGILAAAAVARHFGLTLVDVGSTLEHLQFPKGRMNLLHGIHNTLIIDDTYNAAPASVQAALNTLDALTGAATKLAGRQKIRRMAVLGDMRELGKYEESAHRKIGLVAGERCDLLITVGVAAKFIADSALTLLAPEQVLSFATTAEAQTKIRELIKSGDIILVKGSQGMRLEKVVAEIMLDSDRKADLLVRQSGKWLQF